MKSANVVQIRAAEMMECENCGREIRTGATAYDTDHGACCSRNCAALRIEDAAGCGA